MTEISKGRDLMSKTNVKVCVCSHCVMAGAMDIISSVKSLKKIKPESARTMQLETVSCRSGCGHDLSSPVVYINDEMMENATTQTVMAKILSYRHIPEEEEK